MAYGEPELTERQVALLAPHAEHFHQMMAAVVHGSDQDLADLLEASELCGTTNCGWSSYEAAQYLKKEIGREQLRRKRAAALIGSAAVSQ